MSVDIHNEKYILALAADLEGYVAGGNAGAGRYMSTDLTEAAGALRAFVREPSDAMIDRIAQVVAARMSIPGHSVCQHRPCDIAAIIREVLGKPPKEEA